MKRAGAIPALACAALAGLALAAPPSPTAGLAELDRSAPRAPAPGLAERGRQAAMSAIEETVITARIKAAIAADSGMKDSDISVSTQGGVVTLTGAVKSPEQITIATNLAQRQEGVSRVESKLAVK